MFLLLGGTGVGYSVQKHHVAKLPPIIKPNPNRTYRHLVGDSQEGWAEAINVLFESYTGKRTTTPRFDYSDIRPKGSPLKTSGGKAPGPTPLRNALTIIEGMLIDKENFSSIKPIEAHDMLCRIADAVLSGGIRRSAMISLFSANDRDMLFSKTKEDRDAGRYAWRANANNSAVIVRNRITKNYYNELWDIVDRNNCGEPGFFFTNDKDWGTNPCAEIGLRTNQFCNLSTINVSAIGSQEDLNAAAEAAAFLGTLQATYTDFHFLRSIWKETTEKDALLGVSMTGIASGNLDGLDLTEAVSIIRMVNTEWAAELNINPAARLTCVKPEGTSSLVLGTSSGIHPWWSEYFIRTIRYNREEPIAQYLLETVPNLVALDKDKPEENVILSLPQKAPEGAITRDQESAIDFLERVKYITDNWIKPGHIDGMQTHNVSATVNYKDEELQLVRDWMWVNRDSYNALSVFPYYYDSENGIEEQLPITACDKETYETYLPFLKELDTSQIIEDEDNTDLQGELACAGGSCEII
jgi:ribonucleoside-diphosphate reductase alpha chain